MYQNSLKVRVEYCLIAYNRRSKSVKLKIVWYNKDKQLISVNTERNIFFLVHYLSKTRNEKCLGSYFHFGDTANKSLSRLMHLHSQHKRWKNIRGNLYQNIIRSSYFFKKQYFTLLTHLYRSRNPFRHKNSNGSSVSIFSFFFAMIGRIVWLMPVD